MDVAGKDDNTTLVYEALYQLTKLYLRSGYNVIVEGILSSTVKGKLRIERIARLDKKCKRVFVIQTTKRSIIRQHCWLMVFYLLSKRLVNLKFPLSRIAWADL